MAGWQLDPQGFYCLHPDYQPGERLRIVAGDLEITCTVGDVIPPGQVEAWKVAWVVNLSDEAWVALDLDDATPAGTRVDVYYAPPVQGDNGSGVTISYVPERGRGGGN